MPKTFDDEVGIVAAKKVIASFPLYTQQEYNGEDASHLLLAVQGVVAWLKRRGGTSTTAEIQSWDEVWAADGVADKLLKTTVRARLAPDSTRPTTRDGTKLRPWSDPCNAFYNLPRRMRDD